jgi:hypothetical protein
MKEYQCECCGIYHENILDYCSHMNSLDETFEISNKVLQYLINNNLEPDQDNLDNNILDDGDIIYMVLTKFDDEKITLDLLNIIDIEKCGCIREFDNDEKIKLYLYNNGVIDDLEYKCELNIDNIIEIYNYEQWEKICHHTNDDLLMLCIQKGWATFCLRLLDFDVFYNINKQNVTNSYETAIKYKLFDVAEKIKNHNKFTLVV